MTVAGSYTPVFCWRGFVYLVWGNRSGRVGISHNPGLDRTFWLQRGCRQFSLLTPPLPLGTAAFLCDWLQRRLPLKGEPPLQQAAALVNRGRLKLGLPPWEAPPNTLPEPGPAPVAAELALVQKNLAGRILWREEIALALAEHKGAVNTPLEDLLQWLYLAGEVTLLPGVGYEPNGEPRCRRCGQASRLLKVTCAACGSGDCLVCEGCLAMGQARRCRPLYARPWPAQPAARGRPDLDTRPRLNFALTPAQVDAYREAESFVFQGKEKECLLWAACGAGKTEVTCGAIAAALSRGRNVLYACPRREVIRELEVRLTSVWPQLRILSLYGGSPGKFGTADLILATTHQALRFYRRFDLVILDEVDAFPLSEDPMLYYAVARARREDGQTLFLTATPPAGLVARVRRRQVKVIYLPARHHGHPLPVPEILRDPFLSRPGAKRLPRSLVNCLDLTLAEEVQLIIFVPAVKLVEEVVAWLLQERPGPDPNRPWVQGCYAAHPRRDEIIASFRREEFPVLVTTTVMERGITIPRLNVLVLYADEERIFTANTLIQIAGRAGRSPAYPSGRVWFLASRISPAMAVARRQIQEFNALARRRGYLLAGEK
ncbi:Transcription-repair-coupling factor [Neomoorella glycerini]|uniref:Transcription-repair-coupling factor n=1 Tax=Neomoorella glycerini TaxID=55779 RepID=A0A6I5ZRH5_9FIRM|nr:helicase-related protein [Moorella glycerini]QGP92195.1 Transcription-repair-coupling factor [Moorella glycerini]